MKFLGIGETNDLGAMYLDLASRGHDVKVIIEDKDARDTLAGMVTLADDWRAELPAIKAAGPEGFVLFETASHGALQDQLRGEGYQVIGGSQFGDRLEADRDFGQQVLKRAGMQIADVHGMDNFDEAIRFVRGNPRRWVLKMSGANFASSRTFIGDLEDGRDMADYLENEKKHWDEDEPPRFVLMEYLRGVEVGVGAYFNGKKFTGPVCIDFEHKRLFPGDLGELTGEMGTLVSYRGSERIFAATLGKLASALSEGGYCGYINLNTIIDADGVWPLELTSRFGYPGFSCLQALHISPWETMFSALVRGEEADFHTHDGFAVGVVLTVPPFPNKDNYEELGKGRPIYFREPWKKEDLEHLHYSEVAKVDGRLVTSGMIGYIMVVTGRGATPMEAKAEAYRRVRNISIPNMRYRIDIGDRFENGDRALLEKWGWFGPNPNSRR